MMNPGVSEEAGKTVRGVVDGLKAQPLMLALIILNVVVFAAVFWSIQKQRDFEFKLNQTDQATIAKAMDLLSRCVNPETLNGLGK